MDVEAAVRTLASFLSAAGESYWYALNHPGSEPENLGLFPSWVAEAAYLNGDELAMLAAEEERLDDPTTEQAVPAMYVSVVFQQGDDAGETLNIIDESGPQAAVDHLVQWDFGRETEEAAEVYGGIYDEPPAGDDDRTYASGEYVMTYSHLDRDRPTRQTTWPGEQPESTDDTGDTTIVNRDEDFVQFVIDDVHRRRQAEAEFKPRNTD